MENRDVPYIAFEGALARMERVTKRLALLAGVALLLLFISNAVWLYAWARYDYGVEETTTVSQDVSQDGEGNNVELNNGADSTDEDN